MRLSGSLVRGAAALLLGVVSTGPAAWACIEISLVPTVFRCVEPVGSQGSITFEGRMAFGAAPGTFCACGIASSAVSSVITSVDAVTVLVAGTVDPVPQFDTFDPNATTSAAFDAIQSSNWRGFLSMINSLANEGPMPGPIDIRVDLGVVPGTTCDDLIDELNDQEAGLLGTDKANSDGTLTGLHQSINTMEGYVAVVPALGIVALGVAASALLGAGIWSARRRP